ncbi:MULTISPECIES: HAD family hydrolase [Methanoculleus]|uniref:HAD-superfamily hydrolase, subfamily IA, variant 1 n=2 Tax=Methanoculleus TaxID=45989 RepID=A3CXL1_METMJ|nr:MULTISPECIES: HAD family hydrolase [Methanoculleus]ABN58111.1 HAD-superfamily hydrolase, subfamily IA, variant 1 [Methanoculleus marisnigri JR1]MCC7554775.1 HAD family hydrolase [Methanoculleus marisnigri]UYU19493.1 HAD family hydrolase [Methanoculleus submarinus]
MSRRDPPVTGVLFDCYGTLIDVLTDEGDIETYRCLSRWLIYQGVRIAPEDLQDLYTGGVREAIERAGGPYSEVRVEEVFAGICAEHAVWKIDTKRLGIESARAFRAASLRRLGVIERTRELLDLFGAKKTGVVSNGQRVFSEREMRALGLYDRLGFVIFSSDLGYQKPDDRIYAAALERMRLSAPEVLFIGDNAENDVDAPRRFGMQALHVEEAWERYGV